MNLIAFRNHGGVLSATAHRFRFLHRYFRAMLTFPALAGLANCCEIISSRFLFVVGVVDIVSFQGQTFNTSSTISARTIACIHSALDHRNV